MWAWVWDSRNKGRTIRKVMGGGGGGGGGGFKG